MIKRIILLVIFVLLTSNSYAVTRDPASRHYEPAWFGGGGAYPMIIPDIEIPNKIYMTSDVAGNFVSTDKGENWDFMNDGTTSIINAVIAQSEYNPDIMYSLGRKLLKSVNRGKTWNAVADFIGTRTTNYKSIAIDRNNPNIVYVALDNGKIERTLDGAVSWADYATPFANIAAAQTTQADCTAVSGSWNSTTSICSGIKPTFLYINPTSTYLIVGSLSAGMIRYDLATGSPTAISLTGTNALYNRDFGTYVSNGTEYFCVTAGLKVACSPDSGFSWTYTATAVDNSLYFIKRLGVRKTSTTSTFPTTGILDDFNRANVGPPPSASWTTTATEGFKVVSNQLKGDVAFADSYWNSSYGPDMEAYLTIVTKENDGDGTVLQVRFDPATQNSYYILVTSLPGNDLIEIRKWNGSSTLLASFNQEISSGDSVGISAVGSTITAYYKPASGSWSALGSATDTTFAGGGANTHIDVFTTSTTAAFDNLGGGTVDTSTAVKFLVHAHKLTTPYGVVYDMLSSNSGATWTDIQANVTVSTSENPLNEWGSFGILGNVNSIAVDPFNEDVWYITTDGTMWRSDNGGMNWTENIKGAQNDVLTDISVAPNGDVFVTGMDVGLLKSTDNATTWNSVMPNTSNAAPQGFSVAGFYWRVLTIGTKADWDAGQGIVVTTFSQWTDFLPRVAVSFNNGNTFTISSSGLPTTLLNSTAGPNAACWGIGYPRGLAKSADGSVLYLSIDGYSATEQGGIFRSTDHGLTWTRTTQPPGWRVFNALAVDPTDPTGNTVIFSEWFKPSGTLPKTYKSTNGGTTWTEVSSNIGDFDMAYNSAGNVFKVGLNTFPRIDYSTNGDSGQWFSMHNLNSTSQVADGLYVDPDNPGRVIVGINDGTNTGPTVTIGTGGGNSSATTAINQSVYITNNATAFADASWTDISGDLKSPAGIAAIAINTHFGTKGYLYIATDGAGLFKLNLDDTTTVTLTNVTIGP